MSRLLTSSPIGNTPMRIFSCPNLGVTSDIIKQPALTVFIQQSELTLATSTGVPLARWGNGLTVRLEKVFGNIYMDKMQAICLLEADYDWLNKFVFAKQMMDKAFEGGIIPVEQFAKRGSQATEGVLTSGLFCNIAQALHKTVAIESVDLANCYDAVAHPIASIALQSFKVCKVKGGNDPICAQNHDLVSKDSVWSE